MKFTLDEFTTILAALDHYRKRHIPFEDAPKLRELCEKVYAFYREAYEAEPPNPPQDYSFEMGV